MLLLRPPYAPADLEARGRPFEPLVPWAAMMRDGGVNQHLGVGTQERHQLPTAFKPVPRGREQEKIPLLGTLPAVPRLPPTVRQFKM